MLDQPYMTDLIEANSMGHEPNKIHIYSASWGPTDDGKTVDGPRNATMRAIVQGVNEVSTQSSFSCFILLFFRFIVAIRQLMFINCNVRVATVWATSMCGRRVMVVRRTIAIAMDMRHRCGLFRLTAPSTMARMHIMTRAAAQRWQVRSAMVPKTQTPVWPPQICMASVRQRIREPALPLRRRPVSSH